MCRAQSDTSRQWRMVPSAAIVVVGLEPAMSQIYTCPICYLFTATSRDCFAGIALATAILTSLWLHRIPLRYRLRPHPRASFYGDPVHELAYEEQRTATKASFVARRSDSRATEGESATAR